MLSITVEKLDFYITTLCILTLGLIVIKYCSQMGKSDQVPVKYTSLNDQHNSICIAIRNANAEKLSGEIMDSIISFSEKWGHTSQGENAASRLYILYCRKERQLKKARIISIQH